jgi:hypothetical protein
LDDGEAPGAAHSSWPLWRNQTYASGERRGFTAVEEPEKQISLHFNDHVVIEISLKREDRTGEEAVMFQDGSGKLWNVW